MEYQSLTDEDLAGRVKTDDHAALSEIIRRYQNKLFYYVSRMIGNGDEAEDVVQETFLKAYQNIQSFDNEKKLSPWLYRIAHNLTINQLKKNQRVRAVEAATLDWLDEEGQRLEVDDFLAKEERQQLSEAMIGLLEHLRPEFKEVLLLYYFEEKSYQEISEILRIPEATVGVWLRRAKEGVKRLMEKHGHI
jgi:RNA polymerase sigma-70 factor (ECF subfamily)